MSLATTVAGKLNYLNEQDKVAANATLPYSGYTKVSKKLDNFVFNTTASFLYKVGDLNQFVKFGNKVVDTYGPELVVNGDFSDGLNGWSSASGAILSRSQQGYIIVTLATGDTVCAVKPTTNIVTTPNKDYMLTFEILKETASSNCELSISNSNFSKKVGLQAGKYSYIFTSTNTSCELYFEVRGISTQYAEFDNISVKEIQTADYTNTAPDVSEIITNGSNTTSVAVASGDFVVTEYSSTALQTAETSFTVAVENGALFLIGQKVYVKPTSDLAYTDIITDIIGNLLTFATSRTKTAENYVIRKVLTTFRAKILAPIGTALTNTTYFQDRTQEGVRSQALAYHAYNTVTNAYEGIKTEVLFVDVSKADLLDNSVWLANNGFSKVSQFLYSKSDYLILPVSIWESLNKGAYSPIINPFGTARFADSVNGTTYDQGDIWYETSNTNLKAVNISDCFASIIEVGQISDGLVHRYSTSGAIARGLSGRPDGKFYDIVYPDQLSCVKEYAKIATDLELKIIRNDKEDNGVSETVFTEQVLQTTTGTVATLEVSNGTKYRVNDVLQIWNGATAYRRYISSISSNTVTLDSTIVKTAVVFTISGGKLPILSSGTSLSNMIYGNPQYYPQVLKDRLASGVYCVGLEPVLIEN